MSYPPHEPPPPADQPVQPQQPYVPGYTPPPGQGPEAPGYGSGYGPTPSGQGPEAPGYGYGYGPTPSPYYPAYPYPYPYGYGPARETEGLAIASLVVSCAAILGICTWGIGGVLGIVGAILGHVARRRLRHNGRSGGGMALAGIIVGWVLGAVGLAMAVVLVVLFTTSNSTQST